MPARAGRVVVATFACLLSLTGCETAGRLGDLFQLKTDSTGGYAAQGDPGATGTAAFPQDLAPDAVPKGLLGKDPNDDLNLGKKHFRAANFGLAERHFRRAVDAVIKQASAPPPPPADH